MRFMASINRSAHYSLAQAVFRLCVCGGGADTKEDNNDNLIADITATERFCNNSLTIRQSDMCIVFMYVNNEPQSNGYQLIVAHNRDEFYARPTKPANFWADNPDCISGEFPA